MRDAITGLLLRDAEHGFLCLTNLLSALSIATRLLSDVKMRFVEFSTTFHVHNRRIFYTFRRPWGTFLGG